MLPYLSPTSLFSKEKEAVKTRAASNWGGYVSITNCQESIKQLQEGNDHLNPEPTTTQMATNQVTSADETVVQQTNANTSLGRFVIPKVSKRGLNLNKANEVAARVSPPSPNDPSETSWYSTESAISLDKWSETTEEEEVEDRRESTPDRPSGPLLEEMPQLVVLPTGHLARCLRNLITTLTSPMIYQA